MEELEQRLVRVAAVTEAATDIRVFELVAADRRPLAPFTPGSHIDVWTPGGPMRQYSLCGDPRDASRYAIAVKREPESRGGSVAMFERAEAGTSLAIAGPRNFFALAPHAKRHLFIAGGVGITPIRAMILALAAEGADWHLHYCARSEAHAAFHDALRALDASRVDGHFGETPTLDVNALLREAPDGTHLYCCGPAALMQAVSEAAAHWPQGTVHFEWFAAPRSEHAPNTAFEVELARAGLVVEVPADRTILDVVREHGIDVMSACEEGVCGTCETAVLAGDPEHRDLLLSPEERAAGKSMMICVSRCKSARLTLDL